MTSATSFSVGENRVCTRTLFSKLQFWAEGGKRWEKTRQSKLNSFGKFLKKKKKKKMFGVIQNGGKGSSKCCHVKIEIFLPYEATILN